MRVILEGVSGANANRIGRQAGVSERTVSLFISNRRETKPESINALEWFIWQQLNRAVLLAPCDLTVEPSA